MWEFPGGKIEHGESPRVALAREIREELLIDITVGEEVVSTTHEYEFGIVTLTTYYCELSSGVPRLTEHAAMCWLAPSQLLSVEWAPADLPAVDRIRSDLRAGKSGASFSCAPQGAVRPGNCAARSAASSSANRAPRHRELTAGRFALAPTISHPAIGRGAVLVVERLLSGARQRGVCKE